MPNTTCSILFILAWMAVLLGSSRCIYFLVKKNRPREYFALAALTGFGGWLTLIILELYLWRTDYATTPSLLGLDTILPSLPLPLYILIGGLIFLGGTLIHDNWSFDITTVWNRRLQERSNPPSILQSAWAQAKAFALLRPLELYDARTSPQQMDLGNPTTFTPSPWQINALEILQLRSNQYHINPKTDWYRNQECYLGSYGKEQVPIAVFCPLKKPKEIQLLALLDFLNHQAANYDRLYVLIEEGTGASSIQRMGSLEIVYNYKSNLLDELIDFRGYFRNLEKAFCEEKIQQDLDKTLADIYTPLSAHSENTPEIVLPNIEEYLINWTNQEQSAKHLAVLGEYGQGKSVLSKKLSWALSQQPQGRIPILIELRGKSPRTLSILDILSNWAGLYNVSAKALLKLHEEGRLLLIFEGFDEMDLVGEDRVRLDHFRRLWDFAHYPNAKLLFTGRPNFFLDNKELKRSLGIHQPLSNDIPHCEALYLHLLSPIQIQDSLRHAEPIIQEGILSMLNKRHLEQSDSFYNMIARPSTLFLTSVVWKAAKFEERKEQLNSAVVIQEYIQFAYIRQQKKGYKMPLRQMERQYFMLGIAVGMMKYSGYSNQIHIHTLNDLIEDLLEQWPSLLDQEDSAFERPRVPLKERLLDEKGGWSRKELESIQTDIRSCGILVKETTKDGYFRFAHKSFLECLVSEFYVATLLKEETLSKKMSYGVLKAVKGAKEVDMSEEVVQFSAEFLAKSYGKDTLENAALKLSRVFHANKWRLFYWSFIPVTSLLRNISTVGLKIRKIELFKLLMAFMSFTLILHFMTLSFSQTGLKKLLDTFISLITIYITVKILSEYPLYIYKKVHLWFLTCQQLQIPSSTLQKIIGRRNLKILEQALEQQTNKK
ncbi:MAG: NACHT domain-containing protein [Aureispira sp.]